MTASWGNLQDTASNQYKKVLAQSGATGQTEMNADRIKEVPELIGRLYDIVKTLQEIFKVRPFTPDGHLVGSIGEAVAAYLYDLQLENTCVTAGFDARTKDGNRTVEIKLTAINKVQVSVDGEPDILLVLTLDQETGFNEIYNGPLPTALIQKKKTSKRRVATLYLTELREAQKSCHTKSLPSVDGRSLNDLNLLFPKARTDNDCPMPTAE